MNEKRKLTWSGIGISSNPNQRDHPISLRFQSYLEEASESADKHLIVVADSMQVRNYQTLYGLDERKAKGIAQKKGRQRKSVLERILAARRIENTRVSLFDDVYDQPQRDITNYVRRLFDEDREIREAILSCIPKRLLERTSKIGDIAEYAITEIGLILSLPGAKFGHDREKPYDDAALLIHEKHGLGKRPEFVYSALGMEFIPGKGYTEPYSTKVDDHRILVTDSRRRLVEKVEGASTLGKKTMSRLNAELRKDGLESEESLPHFHSRKIAPTKKRLERPKRILRAVLSSVAAGVLGLVSAGLYISHDIEEIRQKSIRDNITVFALSGPIETFNMAYKTAMENANRQIETKYGLRDYFETK